MRGQPPSRINYSSSDLRQKHTRYMLFAVPIQSVPFIASLSTAVVMECPAPAGFLCDKTAVLSNMIK